jgi:hypothetical protein
VALVRGGTRCDNIRMRRLLLPALLALAACATPPTVPDAERERVTRDLDGQQRYMRVAMYASPLWGDTTKLFLSDQPPSEVELVLSPGGEPIRPPSPERVLAPGTPVRIRQVEFPTTWIIADRVVMSPRFNPWVILEGPGDGRPYVVVLTKDLTRFDDVQAELQRVLTSDDPAPALAALPAEQRNAVLRKEAQEGMSAKALELAWGLPEKKRIDRPAGTEEWTWPGGKRRAFLRDDRVERLEGAPPTFRPPARATR